MKAKLKKYLVWLKAVLFGPDLSKLSVDLGREFGKPFFDEGVVQVFNPDKKSITIIVGKHRSVTLSGRTLEIIGTGTDNLVTDFGNNNVEVYEMVFKRFHLPVILEEMKRMMEKDHVKDAHPDTWYRFTLWNNKDEFNVKEENNG